MLVPIIKELQKHDNLELVVLGLTTAGSVLKRNNIPYIGFKDLLKDNDNALKWGKKLVNKNDLHDLVSYEESVAYMGLNYVDLEIEYGKEEADRIYLEQGRQAFNPISTMEKFLEEESPDLLVATNSPRAERAAIRMAHKLNIPSICLNDLFAIQEVKWLKDKNYATKVCVLSEDVKSYIVAHGRPKDDVVVTGNPAFDNLVEYKNFRNTVRNKNHWKKNDKVIFWASQIEFEEHPITKQKGDPELPRKIEKKLYQIISKYSDWFLVIRHHPSEVVSQDNFILHDRVSYSDTNDSLHELLSGVDVVVTMTSTIGLEGLIIGVPLLSVDLSIFIDDTPYSKMGMSYGCKTLSQIESNLEHIMSKSYIRYELNKSYNSTVKILKIIESLL